MTIRKIPFANSMDKTEILGKSNYFLSDPIRHTAQFVLHLTSHVIMLSIWTMLHFHHMVKINPFPNDKILTMTKLKGFADNNVV